ncbi:uncharacterized protein LOC111354415 [Spodoptera litura]|uniref:Uncharacterized protein LOC111354415 n=1 Tax=Spodoptera litura TaxID=69820 RepID=A0A9J7E3W6_SPOLT|nr:uncharacterized protein LOC111354415 [Spodoptera litura]
MILIAFISVLLPVFDVSVAYIGLDDIYAKITLIESTNEDNKKLNDIFENACGKYYEIDRWSESNLKYQLPHAVIHFAVPGSYNYNHDKVKGNFVYAGSFTDPNEINCFKNVDNEVYCNETANLVNVHLTQLDDGSVFNFVQSFQLDRIHSLTEERCRPGFKSIDNLNTVIICQTLKTNFMTLKNNYNKFDINIIQTDDSSCNETIKDNQHQLLAILRAEPKVDTQIPTVLLRTSYISSEDRTGLPNSMNLVPWPLLKFGILKFIQNVGWQRVVVVSDDSEFSVAFEKELTDLLHKEKIVFASIRCDSAECSLGSLTIKLRKASPMIVIANMEKGNDVFELISKTRHSKSSHSKTTWILRDMKDTELNLLNEQISQLSQNINVFSVSLRSHNSNDYNCDNMDNDIRNGVAIIADAYINRHNINSFTDKTKKNEFYRLFGEKMNEVKRNEAIVCVKRVSPKHQLVSTMYVNDSGAVVRSFKQPFKKVPKDSPFCLAYSYKYFYPCDYVRPLIFLFVVFMFLMTVCWLTCFFDKTTPLNRNNYYRHFD